MAVKLSPPIGGRCRDSLQGVALRDIGTADRRIDVERGLQAARRRREDRKLNGEVQIRADDFERRQMVCSIRARHATSIPCLPADEQSAPLGVVPAKAKMPSTA